LNTRVVPGAAPREPRDVPAFAGLVNTTIRGNGGRSRSRSASPAMRCLLTGEAGWGAAGRLRIRYVPAGT